MNGLQDAVGVNGLQDAVEANDLPASGKGLHITVSPVTSIPYRREIDVSAIPKTNATTTLS